MCTNRWLFPQVSTTVLAHVHKYTLTQVSNYACLRDCYSAAILHLPENPCGIHKFMARELKWNGIERFDCACELSTASCERELLVSKIRLLWWDPMPWRGVHQCWGCPTGLSANWDVIWQEMWQSSYLWLGQSHDLCGTSPYLKDVWYSLETSNQPI